MKGSRHCGAVSYEVTHLDSLGHCHCITCRKTHSASLRHDRRSLAREFPLDRRCAPWWSPVPLLRIAPS
jgi:hypothetical protein